MDGIDEIKEDESIEIRESICINDLRFDSAECEESCLPTSQHFKGGKRPVQRLQGAGKNAVGWIFGLLLKSATNQVT